MNQAQIKYVRQRAEKIFTDRMETLRQKFNVPYVTMTTSEQLDALRKGEFTINEKSNTFRWQECVVFNKQSEAPKVDVKARTEAERKLRAEFDALMDELMIGDQEEAIKLLRNFEGG